MACFLNRGIGHGIIHFSLFIIHYQGDFMRKKERYEKYLDKSDNSFQKVIICAIILTAVIAGIWYWWEQKPEPVAEKTPPPPSSVVTQKTGEKPAEPAPPQAVMDYKKLENDSAFKDEMQQRKETYGVDQGVDMIVAAKESIKIDEATIPMQEILDKIRLKEGGVVEKDISAPQKEGTSENTGTEEAPPGAEIKTLSMQQKDLEAEFKKQIRAGKDVYGIYVVQPGDNIWNIHFDFLKDYFKNREVKLTQRADEPDRGRSSGVGKLLKFSEKMVYIYNLREDRLDVDLDLIHPLSKIVIFNLAQVFSLLEQIDYENIEQIQFDGDTLWIPADSQ